MKNTFLRDFSKINTNKSGHKSERKEMKEMKEMKMSHMKHSSVIKLTPLN